jgi:hypothetical protein
MVAPGATTATNTATNTTGFDRPFLFEGAWRTGAAASAALTAVILETSMLEMPCKGVA